MVLWQTNTEKGNTIKVKVSILEKIFLGLDKILRFQFGWKENLPYSRKKLKVTAQNSRHVFLWKGNLNIPYRVPNSLKSNLSVNTPVL